MLSGCSRKRSSEQKDKKSDLRRTPRPSTRANLLEANFGGANLEGALVEDEQLADLSSLRGATMPNGHKYEDRLEGEEDGENA